MSEHENYQFETASLKQCHYVVDNFADSFDRINRSYQVVSVEQMVTSVDSAP